MSAIANLAARDWTAIAASLDNQGWALMPKLLDGSATARLRGLYDEEIFRRHVIMARHGFGRGEYKYFSYPLPGPIAAWKTAKCCARPARSRALTSKIRARVKSFAR